MTAVSNTRINEFITRSAAQQTVILLDCCSSGMFKSGPIGAQFAGPGRFIVSSTRGAALANDAASPTGTSLFTDSLVEGLLGGAPDSNNDGLIELRHIYDYVRDRLAATSKQVPHSRFDGDATIALARVRSSKGVAGSSSTPIGKQPSERIVPEATREPKPWLRVLTALFVVGLAATAFIVWAFPKSASPRHMNTAASSPRPSARPSPSHTLSSPHPSVGKMYNILGAPALLYTDPNDANSVHGQKSGTAALICARYGFPKNGDDWWYYIGKNLWINDDNIDGHGNTSPLVNACEGTPPHAGQAPLQPLSNPSVSPQSPINPSVNRPPATSSSVNTPPLRCSGAQLNGTLTETNNVLSLNVANAGSSCALPEPVYLQLLDATGQKLRTPGLSAGQTGSVVVASGSNNPALTSVITACYPNEPSAVSGAQTADAYVNFGVNVVGSIRSCLAS
jgi:hypothetical protein